MKQTIPAKAVLESILAAKMPVVRNFHLRAQTWDRTVWAAEGRAMLRDLRIKGVSVTAPNYSMASTIDVRLPSISHSHEGNPRQFELGANEWCPDCRLKWQATEHIERLIYAAFPDLTDTTTHEDRMTDYYNNRHVSIS